MKTAPGSVALLSDKFEALLDSLTASEKRYLSLWPESGKKAGSDRSGTGKKKKTSADFERYQRTLRAMRNYHEYASPDVVLRNGISSVEFLLGKRLYEQCNYELRRLKAIAEEFDRLPELLKLLQLEQDILIEKKPRDVFQLFHQNRLEQLKVSDLFRQQVEMTQIKQEAFILSRNRDMLRSDSLQLQVRNLLARPQLTAPAPESFQLCHLYWNIHALCSVCLGDGSRAANCYEQMLVLWDNSPNRIREDSLVYKLILSNYLSVCHSLGRFERIPELTERMESIPCRNAEEEAEQFQNIYFVRLLHRMNTDQLDDFDGFVVLVENGMNKFRTKINRAREIMFCYNIAVSYFILHRWADSLNWVQRIIQSDKTEHRLDIQAFARIFRLVLYFELGKSDLLEYEMINSERYLRKRKLWFAYESAVVKFIAKLLEADSKKQKIMFGEFPALLSKTLAGERKLTLPGHTELLLWASHHAGGQSIRKLLSES